MSIVTDSIVFQFLTSDMFTDIMKPLTMVAVVAFMLWVAIKPRLMNRGMVQ